MLFETGLDYEAYEAEYEEAAAYEEEDWADDEMGYNPYLGCYDFDC